MDAFSRLPCAVTTVSHQDQMVTIRRAQRADKVLSTLQKVVQVTDQLWNKYPLKRYWQLWHQLTVRNSVLCRTYTPSPLQDEVTVPVLPPSLRQETLYQCHDLPTAGHQGMEKTLERLRKEAYWVGITRDVDNYCRRCLVCQAAKHVTPTKAPLVNTPIGRPWQMVVADILEVPLSTNNNWYLLVVQDYFTKWGEAIPLPDQTASRIAKGAYKDIHHIWMPGYLSLGPGSELREHCPPKCMH